METTVQLVGGPTAVITYAGLRWLTDPAFSPPRTYDGLTKLTGPALAGESLDPIDVVLLSHDHHADNLDPDGRAFLPRATLVLTTVDGAARLGGNAVGLAVGATHDVPRPDGGAVHVTAVHAQHGPDGTDELTGPVIGFVLDTDGWPRLYVSGDNASVDVVRAIADQHGPIDQAVLFVGAVQIPRFAAEYLTLSGDRAAQATIALGARAVVPVHAEGWGHFTQGVEAVRAAFDESDIGNRLRVAERGETVTL